MDQVGSHRQGRPDAVRHLPRVVAREAPDEEAFQLRVGREGLAKFAAATGLPLETPDVVEFAVFFRQVDDKRNPGTKRILLVAVRGKQDTTGGCVTEARVLQPMMARLQARAKSGFNTGASFYCRELPDGWHLLRNALFPDFLGWLRGGAWFEVFENRDKGGLDLSY